MSHNFSTVFNPRGEPVVGACTRCGKFRNDALDAEGNLQNCPVGK